MCFAQAKKKKEVIAYNSCDWLFGQCARKSFLCKRLRTTTTTTVDKRGRVSDSTEQAHQEDREQLPGRCQPCKWWRGDISYSALRLLVLLPCLHPHMNLGTIHFCTEKEKKLQSKHITKRFRQINTHKAHTTQQCNTEFLAISHLLQIFFKHKYK